MSAHIETQKQKALTYTLKPSIVEADEAIATINVYLNNAGGLVSIRRLLKN